MPAVRIPLSMGLGAIKGVGEAATQSVIDSRIQDGPYKDFRFTATELI